MQKLSINATWKVPEKKHWFFRFCWQFFWEKPKGILIFLIRENRQIIDYKIPIISGKKKSKPNRVPICSYFSGLFHGIFVPFFDSNPKHRTSMIFGEDAELLLKKQWNLCAVLLWWGGIFSVHRAMMDFWKKFEVRNVREISLIIPKY